MVKAVKDMEFLRKLGVKAEYKYFHRSFLGPDGERQAQIGPAEIAVFRSNCSSCRNTWPLIRRP